MAEPQLTDVAGIGEAGAARLRQAGIASPEALADASLDDLAAVPGFGRLTAARIKRSARSLVGRSRPAAAADVPVADDGAGDAGDKKSKKGKRGKKGKKGKKRKKGKKKGKGGKKR